MATVAPGAGIDIKLGLLPSPRVARAQDHQERGVILHTQHDDYGHSCSCHFRNSSSVFVQQAPFC